MLDYSLWTPLLPLSGANCKAYSHFADLAKAGQKPGSDKMDSVVQVLKTALL